MKAFKIAIMVSLMLFASTTVVLAADFDWIKDFNITAQADQGGFRAQLSTRFKIGDAQINSVIGNVESPGDAYMVLRLGEMSGQPMEKVLGEYKARKSKGWGVMAKSLGIKPGSAEFRALKKGHDMGGTPAKGKKPRNKKPSVKKSKG